MPEGDYFIDVGKDNNSFKLIIRDASGNIVKVFDDSLSLVQQAWNEVSQLIENYHLMIYGRVKTYEDGDLIFDFFKRALFVIILEQDASYLANLNGYRIKYPDFAFYIATLYKIYKAFVNPKSTLDPQEFIAIIGPLLTKVDLDISGSELSNLFDTFAANYYKAIDFIKKERLGINFMPAVEKPMGEEPNTVATQPNEVAIKPSTTVTQPNTIGTQPTATPPRTVLTSAPPIPKPPQPANNPPRVIPQKPPEVTKPNIENKPNPSIPKENTPPALEEKSMPAPKEEIKPKPTRNIQIEHKRPKQS